MRGWRASLGAGHTCPGCEDTRWLKFEHGAAGAWDGCENFLRGALLARFNPVVRDRLMR